MDGGDLSVASPEIDGYELIETLGTGGFASVYLATRNEDDQRVAIKVLHAHATNDSDLRRFERERNTMRAFDGHPNIVRVFDSGETPDGAQYTVLELIDGGSVREMLTAQGALQWHEVIRIAVQICSALDVAHRSGVLHRDVKPGNVLIDDDVVKLSDFGIARLVGQSQVTAAQSIVGTLAYTPPEVFHNNPFDGRGDIYQLGVTMYEMLLGRAPFTSAASENKAAIIRRIIDKPAPPLAQFDIPQPLSDFLDEVLAKDPGDRPQSAERFAARLNEIEDELGRLPTPMHRDTAPPTGGIDTVQAPTMPMSFESDLTIDAGDAVPAGEARVDEASVESDFGDEAGNLESERSSSPNETTDWPAAAGTPTPPVIEPPHDVNLTVAEPRPEAATSILAAPIETPASSTSEPAPKARGASKKASATGASKAGRPSIESDPATAPQHSAPEERPSRAPWVFLLIALIVVGGAGVAFALTQLDQDGNDGTAAEDQDDVTTTEDDAGTNDTPAEDEPEEESDAQSEFAPVDSDVFAEPDGDAGVVFASVANSAGLTMVGGVGDSGSLRDQRSVVWTLGDDGFAMQRDLDDSGAHRMWSIGVNQETFLAVGATTGPDGIAWTGDRAANFAPVVNSDFTGAADDRLRVSVFDAQQGSNFLVGGSRSVGTTAIAQVWEVSGEPSWAEPTWTRANLGGDVPGVINDIAVGDDFAVAVGETEVDGNNTSLVLIRRDGQWSPLISQLADVSFWGVAISGDQIIIVGEENTDADATPIAVVTDSDGVGLSHSLPIRDEANGGDDVSGIARAARVLNDGSIIAIGDVGRGADPDNDRGGAIWQYLPDEEAWSTRASTDLLADGFAELWTINEYQDQVYIFGRTETDDGRRTAGAWTFSG